MIRTALRVLLALFYAFAGVAHLQNPGVFLAITPDWVPYPAEVVALTGVAELAGAFGLLIPRGWISWARPAAGIGLALYALCVWPANFNHAINKEESRAAPFYNDNSQHYTIQKEDELLP